MAVPKYKLNGGVIGTLEEDLRELIKNTLSNTSPNKAKEYVSALESGLKNSPESEKEKITRKLLGVNPKEVVYYGEALRWGLGYVDGVKEISTDKLIGEKILLDTPLNYQEELKNFYILELFKGYSRKVIEELLVEDPRELIVDELLKKGPIDSRRYGCGLGFGLEYVPKGNKYVIAEELLGKKPSEAKTCGEHIKQLLEFACEKKKRKSASKLRGKNPEEREDYLAGLRAKVYKEKIVEIAEILDIDKSEI